MNPELLGDLERFVGGVAAALRQGVSRHTLRLSLSRDGMSNEEIDLLLETAEMEMQS